MKGATAEQRESCVLCESPADGALLCDDCFETGQDFAPKEGFVTIVVDSDGLIMQARPRMKPIRKTMEGNA